MTETGPTLLVTSLGRPDAGRGVAAAIVIAAVSAAAGAEDSDGDAGAALLDLVPCRPPRPGILCSPAARAVAATISDERDDLHVAPRGHLCRIGMREDLPPIEELAGIRRGLGQSCVAIHVAPARLLAALAAIERDSPAAVVVGAGEGPDPRLPLAVGEVRALGVPIKVWRRPPGSIGVRRALAGIDPGGGMAERARSHARALLGPAAGRLSRQAGQALPAVLGLAIVVVAIGLALAALGGALTGKARAQRAADLAAISAARSLRDDFDRLFVPAVRPDGSPSPHHLEREEYLRRARAAALGAARRNGAERSGARVEFPDRDSFAPVRVRVRLRVAVGEGGRDATEVQAEAIAEPGAAAGEQPGIASGGGYAGPLVYRQGEGMRPDVAAAFDRMGAAARRAGVSLVISSGFRSDAEQARLFAQNPDPRWVAPPGRSLHRCGTELDLGPPSAYGWLAVNAARFGFVKRYSWEPWHFGYDRGAAPCSAAADRAGGSTARGDGRAGGGGLPSFVPPRYRAPLLRSAARHGVSAALLAAQIMAESNFNPSAVSPAGARGISQFMPATAASYGLRDPFDPVASIDAQARMMAELLERFDSTRLALAAYNAGPGPVAACGCVPPYAETQGYVARILGLLGGAGVLQAGPPPLEVRLVR